MEILFCISQSGILLLSYRVVKMYKGDKHDDKKLINNTFLCEKVGRRNMGQMMENRTRILMIINFSVTVLAANRPKKGVQLLGEREQG